MLGQERPPVPRTSAPNTRYSYHADSLDSVSSSSGARTITARKRVTQHSFPNSTPGLSQQQQTHSKTQQKQPTGDHSRRRSTSVASTATTKLLTSPEAVLAKEKEFMANTRILAMSSLIDSFASSTHSKQGFYGKQLKIIGTANPWSSTSSTTPATGSELDITVKVHIIDNTWTTCPLLPPSTILHRWNVTYLSASASGENEFAQEDFGHDLAASRDEKDAAWVQSTADRIETLSPASSPTYDPRPKRPFSVASASSFLAPTAAPTTHVAVISNALCFVANKAGDYLVHLSIHVPFATGSDNVIHLSQIPKCRSNFVKLQVLQPNTTSQDDAAATPETTTSDNETHKQPRSETQRAVDGFDFNVHPQIMSLDEAHLNPESDEDAQFWLEVQEQLVGREEFVGKLVSVDGKQDPFATDSGETADHQTSAERDHPFEVAGCFAPSSSLHVSWMSRSAADFAQDVEQEMTIRIMGVPDQKQPSSLLQDRRRKDPAEIHAQDTLPVFEEPVEEEYDHLEMDDSDLTIAVEDTITVSIQKLGWKQPFMDVAVSRKDLCSEHGLSSDITLLDLTGDAVQDWEALPMAAQDVMAEQDVDDVERDATDDNSKEPTHTFRVWFFAGTEGITVVNIRFQACQAVNVGYGKDILCHMPNVRVVGARTDKGRIHLYTNNDLMIREVNNRLVEETLIDSHLSLEDNPSQPNARHFQYQTSDYCLAVIAQRYQALARIARIERVRVEIGLSAQQQPGFARMILSNVVLPQQDDPYLRLYQLEGAEIWSVLVDGYPCSKSIQLQDQRLSGHRTVLVPIPEEASLDNEAAMHQVEISYGFNSFDLLEEESDEETASSAMRLVVPAFSLPVGEYIVVANLPKLLHDMDYEELAGDFEVMSTLGQPGQRKTITYGAYMTLGRPKLTFRTIKLPSSLQSADGTDNGAAGSAQPDQTLDPSDQQLGGTTVHDPQQPPPVAGHVVVQQVHQRHPQQPPEPQNPHAEQGLDGDVLRVLGNRMLSQDGSPCTASGHGSNLAPQIGAPALQSGTPSGKGGYSLESFTAQQVLDLVRGWRRIVMSVIAALLLVLVIINVAAFQETRSTSLDLVIMPAWSRPFVMIKRFWSDSRTSSPSPSSASSGSQDSWDNRDNGYEDSTEEEFVDFERIVTYTSTTIIKHTAEPQETTEMSHIRDLEILPRPGPKKPDPFDEDDEGRDGGSHKPKGFMKIIQALKDIVQGLKGQ
ncbi:hypothetical protein BGX24_012658 [Mortierella sp. AD032]|nr:hypothetical protein BGX24_012658 [Mortierella sp. AD032]